MNQDSLYTAQLINVLSYGAEAAPPASVALRAGALSLTFAEGQLRRIFYGKHEVLRRIYFAARNPAWCTAANRITLTRQEIQADSFLITYQADVRLAELHLELKASLSGMSDGCIVFAIQALALKDFDSNRVGLCVLHPGSCAGKACGVTHTDGAIEHGRFPAQVAPHQPFTAIRSIVHSVQGGVQAMVEFEGAVFEMEDQRNWSDASFKTYSGQLSADRPLPIHIAAGTHISQKVTLRLLATRSALNRKQPRHVTLKCEESAFQPLPALGLVMPAGVPRLNETETAPLRYLNLQHLRLELDLNEPEAVHKLHHMAGTHLPLELALSLTSNCEHKLAELARILAQTKPDIRRWLLYNAPGVQVGKVCALLRRLTPGVPIGSGSYENLAELNRTHPDLSSLDLVCFALNPQVHQTDNDNLVENLGSQRALVATARAIAGGKPVVISPVSLKPRLISEGHGFKRLPNPVETAALADARYISLLGASWLALTLANLASSGGVVSITGFDIFGWNGVMERTGEAAFSTRWPELAGAYFPAYHVMAWLGRWAGGEVIEVSSSTPLAVGAIGFRRNGSSGYLVCNLTGKDQEARIAASGRTWRRKTLHKDNVQVSLCRADYLVAEESVEIMPFHGMCHIDLPPYALAFLESNG
jgi:D-apionolactonase